jgi:hypothetical protein
MAVRDVRVGMPEADFVDAIATALLEYLNINLGTTSADLAAMTGYSLVSIKAFRCGAYRSIRMATRLAECLPELADGLRCPHCHGLPGLAYDYPPPPRASRRLLPSSE